MKKNGDDTLKIEFLKLKNALIDRYKILIPIFGIMLILSGFWVYEASSPTYENKEQNVTTHTDHGWYSYTVPVTKENPLYPIAVSYTHLRAHETDSYLVCRLLLEKKKTIQRRSTQT